MNKTGLAALAALLGAGLITTKTFKSSYASETFMAKGKRAVALRAGKINSTDLKDVYYDQWSSKYADVLFKNTKTLAFNVVLKKSFLFQLPHHFLRNYQIDGIITVLL